MIKKDIIYLVLLCFFISEIPLQAVERGGEVVNPLLPAVFGQTDTVSEKKTPGSESSNIDIWAAYGQYNNIFSSVNLAQDFEDFTYHLKSNFRRTDDYGFDNSSFYDGELAFTGVYEINELWKVTPHITVNSESRGMHDNDEYSREEKDKVIVKLQTDYSINPTAWRFSVSGAQYTHKLVTVATGDVDRSSFYKLSEEIVWENIYSASNKFRIQHSYTHYFYSTETYSDDYYTQNRAVADIKVFEYVKLHAAAVGDWNRKTGSFFSGKGGLSSTGLKSAVYEINYEYLLNPFTPEEFYFEQRFIVTDYTLPPQKIHKIDLNYSYDWQAMRTDDSRFRLFGLKGAITYEKYENYYNYSAPDPYILDVETVDAQVVTFRLETHSGWSFLRGMLTLGLNYEYSRYSSAQTITYRPEHKAGATIKYRDDNYEAEWTNTFSNSFYIDNLSNNKLDGYILGSLYLQKRMYETFYLFLKADNLYNRDYSYRLNYPEPGITVSAGMRIKY